MGNGCPSSLEEVPEPYEHSSDRHRRRREESRERRSSHTQTGQLPMVFPKLGAKGEFAIHWHEWEVATLAPHASQLHCLVASSRSIDLITKRILTDVSSLAQIIGTPKVCYASERSVVDPNERQMTLKTTNVTFGSFLSMDEILQYRPHPTDPSKTLLRQQATVSIEGVPLNRYMEEVLTKNIHNNANRGRQGLEWVINKINTEVSWTNLT